MMKKISKIMYSIIIIFIIALQLLPNYTFADYETLQNKSDVVIKKGTVKYYSVVDAAQDLSDKNFDEWSDATLYLLKFALTSNTDGKLNDYIVTTGLKGSTIAYNGGLDKDFYNSLATFCANMLGDVEKLSQFDNNMVASTDVKLGSIKLGEISVNKKEVARIQKFRNKLIEVVDGNSSIGQLTYYWSSAWKTYKVAAIYKGKSDDGMGLIDLTNASDVESRKNYSVDEIKRYYKTYGYNYKGTSNADKNVKKELEQVWEAKLGVSAQEFARQAMREEAERINNKTAEQIDNQDNETQSRVEGLTDDKDKETVFQQPKNITSVAKNGSEDVINDADRFIDNGNDVNEYIQTDNLKDFSQTLYSILFGIGIIVAVIVGGIIGVKLMFAPVAQRAEAKKLLIPYIVGCVVVFGAFGVWKLVVTIIQQV